MRVLDIVAHVIVLYLACAPLIGWRAYKRLLSEVEKGVPGAREAFFRRGIGRKVALVAVVSAWLALTTYRYPFEFNWASPIATMLWSLYCAALIAVSIFYFRRRGDAQLRLLQRMAGGILPQNHAEAQLFKVVAVLAGVGEEVVFRWFLMSYFTTYWGADIWEALAASTLVFGATHAYQGLLGVLMTSVIGAMLGWVWIHTGTLLIPMLLHTLIDLRILFIATPERMAKLHEASRGNN